MELLVFYGQVSRLKTIWVITKYAWNEGRYREDKNYHDQKIGMCSGKIKPTKKSLYNIHFQNGVCYIKVHNLRFYPLIYKGQVICLIVIYYTSNLDYFEK